MCLKKIFLLSVGCVLLFAHLASAAERLGAVAGTNAKSQASAQAAANLGAGGPGSDLRAIATPKQNQTLTGFPAGTLPGDTVGGRGGNTGNFVGKVVLSGEALPPILGEGMLGATFDQVLTVVSHVGYTLVRQRDVLNSLDALYTFDVLSGRSRKARLYFDRSMKVLIVEN